ncbi:bombyxin B-2 homolog isoform X2 [Uloborus diversus]|uniref:bombyxin B-2 homolog isoform X2 n=1 Tax=Uloborus diversus TaxID=327109 RepID=UPI00240A9465|nr:bombyxin B-2 homolog isoform X2 [Uloborus diversus]
MKHLFLLILFIGTYASCLADASDSLPVPHIMKRAVVRLCGNHLVQALSVICDGRYYYPIQEEKRSIEGSYPEWMKFMWEIDANSRPRNKRNIVDECCHKSCTYSSLVSYCA